jgi:hypothetical protein
MSSFKHVFEAPGRLDERTPSISQKMSVLGFIWKIAVWQRVSNMARSYLDPTGLGIQECVETLKNGWPTVERESSGGPFTCSKSLTFLSKALVLPNQAFFRP